MKNKMIKMQRNSLYTLTKEWLICSLLITFYLLLVTF